MVQEKDTHLHSKDLKTSSSAYSLTLHHSTRKGKQECLALFSLL